MPELREVAARLDDLLEPERFSDYCVNGLQIEGKEHLDGSARLKDYFARITERPSFVETGA